MEWKEITDIVIGGAVAWLVVSVVGLIKYRDMFFPHFFKKDNQDE